MCKLYDGDNCKLTCGLDSHRSGGAVFDELVHNNNTVDNTISNISSDLLHNMQKQSEIHMVLVSAIFSARYSERTWPFFQCSA